MTTWPRAARLPRPPLPSPSPTQPRRPPSRSDATDEAAEPVAEDEEAAEPKRRRGRRRGAAETAAPAAKPKAEASPAPRDASGAVAVRAQAKYVRSAPRKARLVMDHIRGKAVGDARAILRHTPRAAAADISKLLESAVANAENNFELDPDDLKIGRAYVDEGPTIKRYRPRALGRATRINKRTSHMTHHADHDRGATSHGTEGSSGVDAGRLHPRLEVDVVLREGVLGLPAGGHPDPGSHRHASCPTRGCRTSRSRRTRARWRSTSTPPGRAS